MNSRKMRAGIGKKLLFAVVITAVLLITQKSFSQLQFEWVRNYPNYQDHSAAIDSSGNIYSVGDSSDYLIILKHNPNSNLIWKRKLNYLKSNSPILVATDKNKYLYVSCSNIAHNYVLTKFDSSGNNIWNRVLVYGAYDEPHGMTIDSAGFIYVTGETMYGSVKCLTIKYSPQGSVIWSRINPDYVMSGRYISLDDSGNVYVAGYYTIPGLGNFFGTLKYNNNGNLKWFSKYRYQNRISYGACVKSDNKGNCYVSGMIDNNTNYISGLLKYDYKGDSIWVKVFGDSLMETGGFSNFYFDDNGNIYVSSIYSLKYDSDGNLLWYRNNSYSLFAFVYKSNNLYCVGRGATSMLINERDCQNGKLISQTVYPQYKWANDIQSYKNYIYIILNASDSLILLKFSTSSINIMNNTTILSDYKLYQNYPNPFNSSTVIRFTLFKPCIVNLKIYDINGEKILTLANGFRQAGEYKETLSLGNLELSTGVYFYSLIVNDVLIETKKLILIK